MACQTVIKGVHHHAPTDRLVFKFESSLVYRVSSRTAKATQRNPVSKNQTTKKEGLVMTQTFNPSTLEEETSGSL